MSGSERPPVLSLSGVVSGYRDLPVLKGISFAVRAGEFITVVGPTGPGQSPPPSPTAPFFFIVRATTDMYTYGIVASFLCL